MSEVNKVLVATYGTLLTGQGNHGVMMRSNGVSQGLGWTTVNANIYDYAHRGYPAVSLTDKSNGTGVRCEVFEVPATYYKPAPEGTEPSDEVLYHGFVLATKEEYDAGEAFLYVGTDGLEGYSDHRGTRNTFYNRSKVPVKLDDGTEVEALMYHIEGDYDGVTLITSGDWVAFKNNGWENEAAE